MIKILSQSGGDKINLERELYWERTAKHISGWLELPLPPLITINGLLDGRDDFSKIWWLE